jgi:hypothetical protein
MNYEIITVSERSQSEMAAYCMIPFTQKATIEKSLGTPIDYYLGGTGSDKSDY